MSDPDFSTLKTKLLRGGVAPKHVNRTLTELRDHFADLRSEALQRGLTEREAHQEAVKRIGTHDAIAGDVLAKPELRSWAARWPWAVYGLSPVITFVASVVGLILVLAAAAELSRSMGFLAPENRHLTPLWLTTSIDVFFLSFVYVWPLMIAAFVCHQVSHRYDGLLWPFVGLVILCVFGAMSDISATWPRTPDALGELQVGFALAPPFPLHLEHLVRTVVNVTLVMAMLHFFRQRVASS